MSRIHSLSPSDRMVAAAVLFRGVPGKNEEEDEEEEDDDDKHGDEEDDDEGEGYSE